MISIHDDAYWRKKSVVYKISLAFQCLFGIYKTLYFNVKYFGVKGLKFPVILSSKVKLKKCKGKVIINSTFYTGMIKLGFTTSENFDNSKYSFLWINDGIVIFKGTAGLKNGVVIRNYGKLTFGNEFHISSPSTIICYKEIEFGDDILIGWNCEFADGDAHKIYHINDEEKNRCNEDKNIIVGNHVWFCANVKVQKGVKIGDNIIVAANSIIYKSIEKNNVIVGGNPIKILKENINWQV